MKIQWTTTKNDVKRVREFYAQFGNCILVRKRKERNVDRRNRSFSRHTVWLAIMNCLLTTQQRSGPTSKVYKFIQAESNKLSYEVCQKADNVKELVARTLSEAGLRRYKKISEAIDTIIPWLERDGWKVIEDIIKSLKGNNSLQIEREKADEISDNSNLHGLGPKQSRNLLQMLGLTKYENPIDGRVIKWLNEFGFPIYLTAKALSDKNYYHFVSDGLQLLCNKSRIYPCLLDAAIFTSYDRVEWPDDNVFW